MGIDVKLPYTDEGIANIKDVNIEEVKDMEHEEKTAHLNTQQIQNLFLSDSKINDHVQAINSEKDKYLMQLRLFIKYGVIQKVSTSTKAKILCALLIKNEKKSVEWLMTHGRYYSVGEIAKCIQLLDAPRKARQLKKKLNKLLVAKEKKKKKKILEKKKKKKKKKK